MTDPRELDRLLAGWARSVRIGPDEADRIRRAVIDGPTPVPGLETGLEPGPATAPTSQPPQGLPPSWWRALAVQVADAVVLAHRQRDLGRLPMPVS